MVENFKMEENAPLSGRPRRQYNYFYGSTADATDALTVGTNDTASLIGEALVTTDNEDESSIYNERKIAKAKEKSNLPWLFSKSKIGSGLVNVALVLLGAAIVIACFVLLLLPHSSAPIPETQGVLIPFQQIDRVDYGDPVEGFINLELFHPSLFSKDSHRVFNFAFPTGAFWTNLVVPSSDSIYSYPIVVYPYAYKWSKTELQLCYPTANRLEDKNHHWIIDAFSPDLTLGAAETPNDRFVTKYDPLSVTLRFVASQNSKWETTLVQGSPYTTIRYMQSTPQLKALSTIKAVQCPGDEAEDFHDFVDSNDDDGMFTDQRELFGVCSIEEQEEKTIMKGVQFMFVSEEGAYWILFSSEPIVLEYDQIHKTTIAASAPFTGVLRLAYIPAEVASDTSVFSSTGLRRLIYHAGVYPTGADVSWDFHPKTSTARGKKTSKLLSKSTGNATLQFTFSTATLTDTTNLAETSAIELLMLALPHHVQTLPKTVQLRHDKRFDLIYKCIKGPMTPIIGSQWTFHEPLHDLDFETPGTNTVDPGVRQTILEQVEDDLTRVLPTLDENVYGFGKQIARVAQLALIAHELEEDVDDDEVSDTSMNQNASLRTRSMEVLLKFLQSFLTSKVSDYLVFDGNLGGLVSKNGISDKSEDFGNGRYNDHHFHYGYILYASAIMAKLDPAFMEAYGSYVDAILHDIAHPLNGNSAPVSSSSAFFPLSRHKSWFDGHSFATGMFAFGDGKSQESSSEAVNAYYGAYLWSTVRHGVGSVGSDLTDFARLLFALEVRGARTYWHMIPKSSVDNSTEGIEDSSISLSHLYGSTFEENYMVGNVGMLDVACNTWFGDDALYVHMINAIPITGATSVLFDADYVREEYEYLMKSRNEVEMAWRGYTVSIHAIVDANQAWEEAQDIVSYELDSAISKSQVLYWILSRPDFNVTVEVHNTTTSTTTSPFSSCSVHPKCVEASITGECCPTTDGITLGCCGSLVASSVDGEKEVTDDDESTRQCDQHPDCVEIGLTGYCCPTNDGILLGCCGSV